MSSVSPFLVNSQHNVTLKCLIFHSLIHLFLIKSTAQSMAEGQETLSQQFCYLPRNPILHSGFLFPWSETSFPGGSTGWTRHRDADAALAWPCPVTITPSCCCPSSPPWYTSPISARSTRQEACCALDLAWANETKSACWRVGRWDGGSYLGSPHFPPVHYETSRPLMQMRWWGQREKNNMKGKTDTKEGWEGIRPPKAAQHWGPFQITAAVTVNQVVSVNNVRPEQAGLMSSLLCPTPNHQHLPNSPPSTSPLWPHESD